MLFTMKVQKLRDVKTPNRGTSVSAGIDFYVPEDFETDEDYEGEIHLHMVNISDKDQTVATGQKLVQFVLIPVCYFDVEEVAELPSRNTERGAGGFGSTGL